MFLLFLPVVTALCLLAAACCIHDVLREQLAPTLVPGSTPASAALVSVLIPARDEAKRIPDCLDGLVRQSYRNFELIVVDDDSSDGTAAVVERYCAQLPTLEVVAGLALPDDWAGKCWACWQAVEHARGDWLLFLDADVIPQPELLAAMLARAEDRQLDLLTLMPLLRLGSLSERVILPAFMALLYGLYPLDRVSDPRAPIAFANGQCVLIARQAYFASGGHQAVRNSILEDTELGRNVKTTGHRIEAASAPDLIAVRMYTSWASLAEGLGKNAVAGYQSGGGRAAWVGMRQALVAFLPGYLLVFGGLLVAFDRGALLGNVLMLHGALLAMIGLLCWGWLTHKRYRIAAGWGALFPLGTAIYFWLSARALLRLRRGRGVLWKGRSFK